jgi:hypothetical protein
MSLAVSLAWAGDGLQAARRVGLRLEARLRGPAGLVWPHPVEAASGG